ncbi:MAG: DUF1109 domain-containing protein [Paracoccaceae bacterium]
MKTEDLISALAADHEPRRHSLRAKVTLAILPGLVVAALLIAFLWHVRPDLVEALQSPAIAKTIMPAILATFGVWLVSTLARPEGGVGREALGLAALATLAVALFLWSLGTSGTTALRETLSSPNFVSCVVSVPILSLLPLAAAIVVLRDTAPARPALAGAGAGLMVGAAAAAVYSLHCPVDTILFFVPTYGLAIALVSAMGAAVGSRALAW